MSNSFLENQSGLGVDLLISYLNGLLTTLETFNDGPYTGNTFEFSKIDNLGNEPERSIIADRRLPLWTAEMRPTENFYPALEDTLNEYCQAHAWSVKAEIERVSNIKLDDTIVPKILETTNFNMVKVNIHDALKAILKENYIVYAVTLKGTGWYEASYKDYFFDCNGEYYYLHLGVSD